MAGIQAVDNLVNNPIIKTDVNLRQQFCTVAQVSLATTQVAIRNDVSAGPERTEMRQGAQNRVQQTVTAACAPS